MEKNADFVCLLHNSFIRFISNCDSMYKTKKGYGEGLLDVKVFLESLMGMSKEPWPKGAFYKNDKYLT